MMSLKNFLFTCCLAACGLVACKDASSIEELVKKAPIDINGYWGSDMYIKGLLQEKKITVQLICPIAWKNLAFQIKGRQLIRIGLHNEMDTVQMSQHPDSLVLLDGFGSFVLKYNHNAARLEAIGVDKNTGSCSPQNTFRRLTPEEGKAVFELLKTYSIRESLPLGM